MFVFNRGGSGLQVQKRGKGDGRLQIRDWTDKEGGKRRSAEVIADNVYFGDSKPKDGGEEDDIPAYTGAPDSFAVPDGFTPDFGGESGEMPF